METPNSMVGGCVTKLGLEIEGQLDIFISNRRVRATKSRSKPYVPLELCSDILSRLPVKSLLRFRCVSKPWRSLIDDPQFCDLHSDSFKNNSHETHLVINQRNRSLRSLIVCRQTLKKTELIPSIPLGYQLAFAIDGLVLLSNIDRAILWNPSIRRCRRIPHCRRRHEFDGIGIGFDPVSKDYKYVKTSRRRVAVYSVRTNSWKTRRLRAEEEGLSWESYGKEPVAFRGSLYNTRKRKVLLAFSLSSEEFTHQSLPLAMSAEGISFRLAVVDGGSTLAAIGKPWRRPGDCIIWAMATTNGSGGAAVSVCWTKRYTIRMGFERLLFLGGDDEVVFQRRYCRDFFSKGELVAYNMETHKERIIKRKCYPTTTYALVYKESLLLHNEQRLRHHERVSI